MKYPWLKDYCLGKAGAEEEYKIDWEATLYRVGGRIFAMAGGINTVKPYSP